MRILILSQVYWPDTVAVAQHLTDLGAALAKEGHSVKVYTDAHPYEDKSQRYCKREAHQGVQIRRLRSTAFGKRNVLGRLVDFLSFNLLIFWRLLWLKPGRYDVVIGLTTPPLISFLGVLFAHTKRYQFLHWAMDIYPELSIQSGMIARDSWAAKLLTAMGDYTIRHSDHIVTLDAYMQQHMLSRGGQAEQVSVVPVWPVMGKLYQGKRLANPFRQQQGWGDKIVVMYAGNHSVVHPLDNILNLARELQADDRFLFVFIGGGVRKREVTEFKAAHQLANIEQLPYQPREMIHLSLGAADFQVVVMGDAQVGYTHPNKIYGAMFIGKPVLYDGPDVSHVADILRHCPGNIEATNCARVEIMKKALLAMADRPEQLRAIGKNNQAYAFAHFYPEHLLQQMVQIVQQLGPEPVAKPASAQQVAAHPTASAQNGHTNGHRVVNGHALKQSLASSPSTSHLGR